MKVHVRRLHGAAGDLARGVREHPEGLPVDALYVRAGALATDVYFCAMVGNTGNFSICKEN